MSYVIYVIIYYDNSILTAMKRKQRFIFKPNNTYKIVQRFKFFFKCSILPIQTQIFKRNVTQYASLLHCWSWKISEATKASSITVLFTLQLVQFCIFKFGVGGNKNCEKNISTNYDTKMEFGNTLVLTFFIILSALDKHSTSLVCYSETDNMVRVVSWTLL